MASIMQSEVARVELYVNNSGYLTKRISPAKVIKIIELLLLSQSMPFKEHLSMTLGKIKKNLHN